MRLFVALLTVAVLTLGGGVLAETLPDGFNPDTMMPSSQVQRGMKAVGRSVFHGVEITEFSMEILAVLEKANSGKDLIIGRVLDGPVVERQCGVMGGMSGSPVFVDGKIIGAIAFTYIFEKEPVCGITCIESMLVALDRPKASAPVETANRGSQSPSYASGKEYYASRSGGFTVSGRQVSQAKIVRRAEAMKGFEGDDTVLMCPVFAPVYCAGVPAGAMAYLKEQFADRGIEPIAGPGSRRQVVDTDLVAGSAFGGLLASGDFDISTGGTITYRDGDLILGFGHPFMELGKVDVPLTTSWVHDFVPCYNRTDKMMSPMKEAGHLTQDRSWAVGGRLGETAARVPGTFKITDLTRDVTKTYHLDMLKDRGLTGRIIATGALSSIYATYNSGGEGTVRCKFRVKDDRGDEITREDVFYHDGALEGPALGDLMSAISLLNDNRFRPGDITEVQYEAELDDKDNTAAIEGLYADQTIARAGEDVTVRVRLRPDSGEIVEKAFTLKMPEDLQRGKVRIAVGSGTAAMQVRARADVLPPPVFDLDDAITVIQKLEHGNQLFVAAGITNRDTSVRSARLPGLPTIFADLIRGSQRTDVARGGQELSAIADVPWVLYGSAYITLATEDRMGRRGKAATESKPAEDDEQEAAAVAPPGVPASLWWAASAFRTQGSAAAVDNPPVPQPGPAPVADEPEDEKTDEPDKTKQDEKAEGKTEDEDEKEPEKDKTDGAVARVPTVWTQSSADDFSQGEAKGIAVRSDGLACLAPHWAPSGRLPEPYVWALASGSSGTFMGTCDGGKVYRVGSAAPEALFDTGRFGICSLHVAPDGSVLAGTMPGGTVFAITSDGKGSELCTLQADYVWDIVDAPEGGYYIATGAPAVVYHVDAAGKANAIARLKEAHALRLLVAGGALYIGTARRGGLYRRDADGTVVSLYDTADADITDLLAVKDGAVLLSTAPKGSVVSVAPSGEATIVYEDAKRGVMSLARMGDRTIAGLSESGQIVEVINRTTSALLRDVDEGQVTALCSHGAQVFAATSNPGELLVADFSAAAEGTLESDTLDAKRRSRWGRVDWDAAAPDGCGFSLRFRSGNTVDPKDGTWSQWSPPLTAPGRDHVGAPPARFLQYQVQMQRAAGAPWPVLRWVKTSYLPDNQCPTVKDAKPTEAKAISGKSKVTWTMSDPDKDKLRARLLVRPRGQRDYRVIKAGITESEYTWDTRTMQDGVYDLRLVVDDGLSNPDGACEGALDIGDITIDNTEPEVTLLTEAVRQSDGGVAVTGYAVDATSEIAGISWQPKGEDPWQAARLDDGICDWRYERFLIATPPLKETVEELTVRVRDAAGNVTDKAVKVPELEKPKAEG